MLARPASPKVLADRLGIKSGRRRLPRADAARAHLLSSSAHASAAARPSTCTRPSPAPASATTRGRPSSRSPEQRLLSAMLRQIGEYANASAAAGGFDRADANISRIALEARRTRAGSSSPRRPRSGSPRWRRSRTHVQEAPSRSPATSTTSPTSASSSYCSRRCRSVKPRPRTPTRTPRPAASASPAPSVASRKFGRR